MIGRGGRGGCPARELRLARSNPRGVVGPAQVGHGLARRIRPEQVPGERGCSRSAGAAVLTITASAIVGASAGAKPMNQEIRLTRATELGRARLPATVTPATWAPAVNFCPSTPSTACTIALAIVAASCADRGAPERPAGTSLTNPTGSPAR